jgi:hypothetical protein
MSDVETKERKPKEADLHKLIAGLREEITVLRGELEAAVMGPRAIIDRQQAVDRALAKYDSDRKSMGPNEWWLYDRRNEKKDPVVFYSTAKTPKDALADYRSRTGQRFVGQGADPFYVKPPEVKQPQ